MMQDAVDYAWSKGVVLVGAAGNNGVQENFYPAAFHNVVSVSATQVEDEFAQLVELRPEGRRQRAGVSVLSPTAHLHLWRSRHLGHAHLHQRHELRDAERRGRRRADSRSLPVLHAGSRSCRRLFEHRRRPGLRRIRHRYGRGRVNAYRALGGSVSAPALLGGDSLESNNTLTASANHSAWG